MGVVTGNERGKRLSHGPEEYRQKEYTMQKLAFIGFGVVGQGLAEILLKKKDELEQKYGYEYSVVAVSDFKKGAAYKGDGLDLEKLIEFAKDDKIGEYPGAETG